MPTKKQLEEQIKELKLELLMTKNASEIYEKECDEWRKIDGADGLIQDLFYDGYHTTKLCCGIHSEVDEVHKAITEMKNKIDELKEENQDLREEMGEPDNIFGERVWSILYEKDYCPTSYGEAASFIKDIIEENEKLKEELKAGICIGEYLAGEFKKNPH